jgi:hypothetical protein
MVESLILFSVSVSLICDLLSFQKALFETPTVSDGLKVRSDTVMVLAAVIMKGGRNGDSEGRVLLAPCRPELAFSCLRLIRE